MRAITEISFLLLVFTVVLIYCEEKKVARLQIGVKKRVENCIRKSKKGDRLHMHYVVSVFFLYYLQFYPNICC